MNILTGSLVLISPKLHVSVIAELEMYVLTGPNFFHVCSNCMRAQNLVSLTIAAQDIIILFRLVVTIEWYLQFYIYIIKYTKMKELNASEVH
jgi:hypothetical protein